VTPQALVARIAATRPKHLDGFHVSFDHWHSTDSPENVALSQDVYRKLKGAGLVDVRTIEQYFDPVKAMFLPDRYIKGECPKCGAKDQYGDACENCSSVYAPTDLKNPYSALSGAVPVLKSSEHHFFRLSDPACVAFLREWALGGRLQAEVANKAREWLDADGGKGLVDWDISRDAPYFGIRIPDLPPEAPAKYFYVWLDAPIGYLASLQALLDRRGIDFASFLADPALEQVHFIGKDIVYHHTLFWPAMLKFAGAPYRCRTACTCTASSPSPARRCRSRAARASAPTSTSTSGSTPSGCATTSRPSSTRASRTSTSIPTTSSRGSTAT
jgi:methionyl-tRNA synthetase